MSPGQRLKALQQENTAGWASCDAAGFVGSERVPFYRVSYKELLPSAFLSYLVKFLHFYTISYIAQ